MGTELMSDMLNALNLQKPIFDQDTSLEKSTSSNIIPTEINILGAHDENINILDKPTESASEPTEIKVLEPTERNSLKQPGESKFTNKRSEPTRMFWNSQDTAKVQKDTFLDHTSVKNMLHVWVYKLL